MPFRGVLVSRGMYMGVSIDQMTNDGYFPTQKDHLHLLEGYLKIFVLTPPLIIRGSPEIFYPYSDLGGYMCCLAPSLFHTVQRGSARLIVHEWGAVVTW